ncbi:MAG TPA: DUF3048 domain-containing protein [Jiangellales bacterium]|nr:DUF3048 domain-containing protein [Jiangellales bacterium]
MDGRRRFAAVAAAVVAVVAAAIVLAVLLTRDNDRDVTAPEEPGAGVPSTTEPEAQPALEPLTGLVAAEDLAYPAVAVKVSDVRQAHPQLGVDRADIVFAEPIGVSYTRLLAVFHSDLPDLVGPVRSVRPMDAPLLGPMAPVFGNTMGAEWVLDYVDSVADVDNLGTLRVSGSDAYVIDSERPRPDHVFARPAALLELSDFTAAPEPYFSYAPDGEPGSAEAASGPGAGLEVPYGPGWTVTWTYDAANGHYLRAQPWGEHTMADGVQISAVNVLVLDVESRIGKIGEGSGAPVPILQFVDGSGEFTALAGGHSVTGTWSKAGVNEPFEFRTDSGGELRLTPGNTWVELPTPDAAVAIR